MRNFILILSIILLNCQQNKSQEKTIAEKDKDTYISQDKNIGNTIIPVKLDTNLILNWNMDKNRLEEDSLYNTVKNNKQKLRILIDNISNIESVDINICSKKEPLKKGDVAYIYLQDLNYIQNFKCLKMQFDVLEFGCPYPSELLDYIENNRKAVADKIKKCVNF